MTRRLRIIHCLRAPVGGLFRHVLDLSGAQAERGHDVGYVIDSSTADPLTERRLAQAAEHLSLGITRVPMQRLPSLQDFRSTRAVCEVARSKRIDVLHGHGAKGGAYARLVARSLRRSDTPVAAFYTPHGGSLHYPPHSIQGRIYTGIEKILARHTDGLIFECDFIGRVYDERVGAPNVPRRAVPNALQPRDFTPHEPNADAADFLFIGELRILKGVDVLLQALARIAARRSVRAVIVGAGPDAVMFNDLARTLKVEDRVSFPGAMPAQEAFRLGRCLVVPSRAESMPYIVLEAAAAGVPLLATSVGGIPEIVSGTDTSLLPPANVDALTDAMNRFLDAPEVAKARAERLRAAVADRFTVDRAAEAVIAFYAQQLRR